MPRTIHGSYPSGIALTVPGDNPVYAANDATISNSGNPGLFSTTATYWTLTNAGTIFATGTGAAYGIYLAGGGKITNNQGGRISGGSYAVVLRAAGSVANSGGITSSSRGGVLLQAGGTVTNAAGAPISGYRFGVVINTGTGSLTNLGILSASGTTGVGVGLLAGGRVDNNGAGQITGGNYGVNVNGAAGLVNNQGTIAGATRTGVGLLSGGSLSNASGGMVIGGRYGVVGANSAATIGNATLASITGGTDGILLAAVAGTVFNQGAISGGSSRGIELGSGGYVNNSGSGRISGGTYGVAAFKASGTIVNAAGGTIGGGTFGVGQFAAAGSVNNSGVIAGTNRTGVYLAAGGAVTNALGANIFGALYGAVVRGGSGSVSNRGTIQATGSSQQYTAGVNNALAPLAQGGVVLGAGGVVANGLNGRISGLLYGVSVLGAAGSVSNSGTITNSAQSIAVFSQNGTAVAQAPSSAVNLAAGGSIYNALGGQIGSAFYGARIAGGIGTVTNLGTIASTHFGNAGGIDLPAGGNVVNAAGALVSATFIGVWIGSFNSAASSNGSLVNRGSITADDGAGHGAGVWIKAPSAYILNDTGATIHGGLEGVVFYQQTTIVNRGTISGPSGAIGQGNQNLASGISLRLAAAPGAVFTGNVSAPTLGTSANVLELMSASSIGTITGFGTKYQNFGQIALDSGARWSLDGTVSAGQTISFAAGAETLILPNPARVNGTLTGFAAGDVLDLTNLTFATGAAATLSGNTLSVVSGGVTDLFTVSGLAAGTPFQVTRDSGTGSSVSIVSCFAAGTAIRTATGPVAVEHLRTGMLAATDAGETAEIVWIGHRTIDCRRHPDPGAICPVRIRAGAFGAGLPVRDLRLSPDHAIFLHGVLIPIRCLINGTSIRQEAVETVTYYHVELPMHDAILAEDLPVESYLDAGDRSNFANGGGAVTLFPDFSARMWEMAGCAPLVQSGPTLEKAKRTVARHAVDGALWARAN